MRRILAAAAALTLGGLLVLVPVSVTPAQAAETVRALACYSSVTCNPANAPLVAELGVASAGGVTVATGATAGISLGGAASGGMIGFGTVVGASGAAVGLGLLKLHGLDAGVYVETDPDYTEPGGGDFVFPQACYLGTCVEVLAMLPVQHWRPSGAWHSYSFTCLALDGPLGLDGPQLWLGWPEATVTGHLGTVRDLPAVGPFPHYGTSTSFRPYTGPFEGSNRNPPSLSCPAGTTHYAMRDASHSAWKEDWTPALYPDVVGLGSGTNVEADASPQPVADGYHGTIRTTLTCKNSGGTAYVMNSARVDVAQGERIPVPPAECGAGSVATGALVEYQADGSTAWVTIGEGLTPGYVEEWLNDYPDCFNTVTECTLKLWRVANGGMLSSCGEVGQYCPTWAAEAALDPSLYRCSYGPYSVALDYCSVYRSPGTGVLPNDSGQEDEDGKPVPLPPSAPAPDPLPNELQNPDGTPAPSPGGESTEPRECFPTGWGVFNPVEWVLKPIRCAFEPSPGKIGQAQATIAGAWSGSGIGMVLAAVGGAAALVTSFEPSGCEGPHIVIPLSGLGIVDDLEIDGYPLSACEEPAASVAAAARVFGGAVMIFLAGRASLANLAGVINYKGRGPV